MSPTRTGAILLAAALLAHAAPARAAAPEWNQKEVTALARKLLGVVDQIDAAAKVAPQQPTAMQQRTRDAAKNSFFQVRRATADYVAKLEAGRDRELTEAHFRGVKIAFADTRRLARDAVPTPEMEGYLRKADELLSELGRYYPDA